MTITIKDGGRQSPLIKAKKRHLMKFPKTTRERFPAAFSELWISANQYLSVSRPRFPSLLRAAAIEPMEESCFS
jgi:hypothetical protein